jgi:hypothetical protein
MRRLLTHQEYVFAAEATINDVVEHQRQAVSHELEQIGSGALLERTLDELTEQLTQTLRLDIPQLDRDRIRQLPTEEIDMDVSQDPMRGIFDRSQPFYVKGTMVRIAIPFSGDAELFKYGSSPFNSPIPAEISGTDLILAHTAEKPDIARVKEDFDHRIAQINQMLGMITGPAAEWNRQLPGTIRARLEERRAKVERDQTLVLGYPMTTPTKEPESVRLSGSSSTQRKVSKSSQHVETYDLFLSHAREDKDTIARPLYLALTGEGISVWFDEAILRMGDSLRQKIDDGLARCRYGIVILSPKFLSKQWPQRELDGLVARETTSGEKAILPIWHELDHETLLGYSPTLADRVAGRSEDGIDSLVNMILKVLE